MVIRKVFEITANIAIVVVCGVLLFTYVTRRTIRFSGGSFVASPPSLEGQVLQDVSGYRWSDRRDTLVLAVRSGCHYCEESMPFYRRLEGLEDSGGLRVHVLTVVPDGPLAGRKFLADGGLKTDVAFSTPLNSVHVSGTPTLMLVDSHGLVKRAWIGKLSHDTENEVLTAAQR